MTTQARTAASSPGPRSAFAGVKDLAQIALGIAMLFTLERAAAWSLERIGSRFPAFVLALLLLFALLTALRLLWPTGVERLARAAAPATGFLGHWMALFFMPPLVLLPMAPRPSWRDLGTLAFLIAGGFVATFWVAGAVARATSSPRKVAAPAARPNRALWPRRALLGLWSGCLGLAATAWLATGATWPRLIFGLSLSVLAFILAEITRDALVLQGYRFVGACLHPVLLSALLVAFVWRALGLSWSHYLASPSAEHSLLTPGAALALLLRPAVVGLAFALDAQRELLRAQLRALLAGTGAAALFALLGTALGARGLGLAPLYARAVVPRSVTTPVALSMAELLEAHGGLTAVAVVLTGVLGAISATRLARVFGFHSDFVVGVATGAASHGIGTAGLARERPVAAAFSGVSFALMAIWSATLLSHDGFRRELLLLLPK